MPSAAAAWHKEAAASKSNLFFPARYDRVVCTMIAVPCLWPQWFLIEGLQSVTVIRLGSIVTCSLSASIRLRPEFRWLAVRVISKTKEGGKLLTTLPPRGGCALTLRTPGHTAQV